MSEMIKRVAVAIAKVGALEADASAEAMARAAIEAMREPTEAMKTALGCEWDVGRERIWQAMIDAAAPPVEQAKTEVEG